MHKYIIHSTLLIFLAMGALLFFSTPTSTGMFDSASEENEQHQQWWNSMLIDPATGTIPVGVGYKELNFLHGLQQNASYKKTRATTWQSRGPWNVGGRTRAMAIDVKNQNHIIAGAVSGGIWQSMDAGDTWTRVSNINEHPGCVSISQDTRAGKEHIWYAVSGELSGTSASGGGAFYLGDGAFKSIDNGTTWKPIASTAGGVPSNFNSVLQGAWRIVASPVDSVNACLYMACYGSIFRSKDSGNTWTLMLGVNNTNSFYTDVAVTSKGKVYATLSSDGAVQRGIFRSDDGINFTNIVPTFLKSWDRVVIGINPNNENEVYFLGHLPSDTSGGIATYNYENKAEYVCLLKYTYDATNTSVYKGTWENLSANLPVNAAASFDKFNCQGGYDLFVKVQPTTNNVFIGGTNIYRSTDGFKTATKTTQIGGYGVGTSLPFFTVYPNHHPDQHDLLFIKNNATIAYSCSDGGVRKTNDCNASNVVWENKNMGYTTSQLYSVTIDEAIAKDKWLLGGFQDNGNFITPTNDIKHQWLMPVNGDGAINYIAPNKKYCIMSIQLGRLVKVELDNIGNLVARRRIDPAGFTKDDYGFINPLTFDTQNDILYMPIGKKIARLNNVSSIPVNNDYNQLANTWDVFTDTIKNADTSSIAFEEITSLEVSKNGDNTLYFGTNYKELYRITNANTGNPTFKKLGINLLPAGGYVSDIAIDPDSSKNVLICYSNYNVQSLFYSTDTGNSWKYIGGNLEGNTNSSSTNPSIRTVAILKKQDGQRIYFAGTSIGLFSTDTLKPAATVNTNKTTWVQEAANTIGAAVVTDIKVRQQDGYVAIATHGNGIFDSYYSGNTISTDTHVQSYIDVFPNPANQTLQYTFTNTTENNISITVYDMMGNRIISPISKRHLAGTFTYTLNTAALAPAHYMLCVYEGTTNKPIVKHFVVAR